MTIILNIIYTGSGNLCRFDLLKRFSHEEVCTIIVSSGKGRVSEESQKGVKNSTKVGGILPDIGTQGLARDKLMLFCFL